MKTPASVSGLGSGVGAKGTGFTGVLYRLFKGRMRD